MAFQEGMIGDMHDWKLWPVARYMRQEERNTRKRSNQHDILS